MNMVTNVKKSTAIVLAVFLGFFSLLYTYKKDSRLFWICLASLVVSLIPILLLWNYNPPPPDISKYGEMRFVDGPPFGEPYLIGSVLAGISFTLVLCAAWVFTISLAIFRHWQDYKIGNDNGKHTGLWLSIILGPVSWLYRYDRDKWKFWLSLAILIVSLIVIPRMTHAIPFSTIKEINQPGYVDLTLPFSMRFNDFFYNNLWQYSEYYQFKNVRLVSFLVPVVLWAYPVTEGLVRLLCRNKTMVHQGVSESPANPSP